MRTNLLLWKFQYKAVIKSCNFYKFDEIYLFCSFLHLYILFSSIQPKNFLHRFTPEFFQPFYEHILSYLYKKYWNKFSSVLVEFKQSLTRKIFQSGDLSVQTIEKGYMINKILDLKGWSNIRDLHIFSLQERVRERSHLNDTETFGDCKYNVELVHELFHSCAFIQETF